LEIKIKYRVIYFSRTNNTKRIAEKISKKLGCNSVQIIDNIDWKGLLGFLKAGYYSSNNIHIEIQSIEDLNTSDEYILVTPLWAGGLASAVKTFLETIPKSKVHLIVNSIGSQIKNQTGYRSIRCITKIGRNEDTVINDLVNDLRDKK
jgi:protein involved in ribonucleotide reduction